jgi:RND family efflux transporter MFP subunit
MNQSPGRTAAIAAIALGGLAVAQSAAANPFDCLILPNQTVELRSPVEGLIDKVLVQRGDRVRAGQVLVQLESAAETSAVQLSRHRAEALGRLASAESRLDYATKKLERSRDLHAKNFVTAQARDEAEAEKRIIEAELRDARENKQQAALELRHAQDLLQRRVLRSPFDGVVLDRMLNPGDLAESGTGRKPILKLVQVEPLRVEAVLPLATYGKLQARGTADVIPEGLGGAHPAKVKVVDSVFDTASGTFGVRLELPNAAGQLPAGIRCKVDFPALRGTPGAALMRGNSYK